MCLGANARAANKRMKRDYYYKLRKRERNWMQTLSLTRVEQLEYQQGIDASNLGLANAYSELQEKHGELVDQMFTQSQAEWKEYLAKNTGDQLKAAGRLGRSSERISAIEFGQYQKKGSDMVHQLTKATSKLNRAGAQAAGQAKQQQMEMFKNVAFIKNPDMVPPKPVMQNVGYAMFMDALKIGSSVANMAMPFIPQ